jgi:hypothetical protein
MCEEMRMTGCATDAAFACCWSAGMSLLLALSIVIISQAGIHIATRFSVGCPGKVSRKMDSMRSGGI